MAHWGNGGGFDGDFCGMIADAWLVKREKRRAWERFEMRPSALPAIAERGIN